MLSDQIKNSRLYWVYAVFIVILYYLLNYNYTTYRFIEYGMPLLDAGYMSGAIWRNPGLVIPIVEPTTSWHDYHLTIVGSLWAWLSFLFDLVPFKYYSILHAGSLAFVIGVAAWLVQIQAKNFNDTGASIHGSLAILLLLAVSGPMLSIAEFPHTEVLYGGFGVLFLYAGLCRRWLMLAIALAGLFIVREDIPAHAGLVLFSIFVASTVASKRFDIKSTFLWCSLLMLALSIVAVIVQVSLFSAGTSLKVSVLGDPPLSHINREFLENRMPLRVIRSAYVWVPALIGVVFAFIYRNPFLAVGSIALVPWLFLCWVAVARGAGVFDYHYAFPQIVLLLWPTILSASAYRSVWIPEISRHTIWRLQVCILIASSVLYLSIRAIDLYRYPASQTRYVNYLENFGKWYSIDKEEWALLSRDVRQGLDEPGIFVSEGVASINPAGLDNGDVLFNRDFEKQLAGVRCIFMMNLLASYDRQLFINEFPLVADHKFSGVYLRCRDSEFPGTLNPDRWR